MNAGVRARASLPMGDDGLVVEGVVARHLPDHPVGPRPGKRGDSITFNRLAGNTALTMYLAELQPGDRKCAHRHLDETLTYVVSGEGWSEFRQDDRRPRTRIEWRAGDLYATPANAWHEHGTAHPGRPARLLSFKNTRVIARLLGGAPADLAGLRLRDRYDDEPDYFREVRRLPDGRWAAGLLPNVATSPVDTTGAPPGTGVSARDYVMGGHRSITTTVLAVRPAGVVAPYCPMAEEAIVVLAGQGATDMWSLDTPARTVSWQAGDLLSVPYGTWRQHRSTSDDDVRLLCVRNSFMPVAMGVAPSWEARVPDRPPSLLAPRPTADDGP